MDKAGSIVYIKVQLEYTTQWLANTRRTEILGDTNDQIGKVYSSYDRSLSSDNTVPIK